MMYAVSEYDTLSTTSARVFACTSKDEAEELLQRRWEERYNEALADSDISINELETYHEDNFAQILFSDDNFIRFSVCVLEERQEETGLEKPVTNFSDIPEEIKKQILENHRKLVELKGE